MVRVLSLSHRVASLLASPYLYRIPDDEERPDLAPLAPLARYLHGERHHVFQDLRVYLAVLGADLIENTRTFSHYLNLHYRIQHPPPKSPASPGYSTSRAGPLNARFGLGYAL